MEVLPYEQYIENDKLIRIFNPEIDTEELKWHRDLKDRLVRIVKSGGWEYQEENKLPTLLEDGMKIFIPKDSWHRVIAGHDTLIVEIEESD